MWGALLSYLVGLIAIGIIYPLLTAFYVEVRETLIPALFPDEVPREVVEIMPYIEAGVHLFPVMAFTLLTIWLIVTLYRYSVEGREYRV